MGRIVCWFSCGAASAVATKLAIANAHKVWPEATQVVVARIWIVNEDRDNDRFARDCEEWFGVPIEELINREHQGNIYSVFEKARYISGPYGAPCTRELKRKVREEFQRPTDIHVFGYTLEERGRFDALLDANADLHVWDVLGERGLDKGDCLSIVERAGIKLPKQYERGFEHNNCTTCVKATSAGYWNLVRVHHPDDFERMAKVSRRIGARLVKIKDERIFLDELDPKAGNIKEQGTIQCGIFCEMAEKEISEHDPRPDQAP